jgi:hypothetical protein
MKLGTTISSAAHVGILLWGTLSLQNAKTFEVAEVEALPVDFIPIESITRSIKGDPKANKAEKPAPTPTKSPPAKEPAENVGDTKLDVKSEVKAPPKPKPVEVSAPPPKAKEPEPAPVAKPEPESQKVEEETPVPTTEIASLNEPPEPVREEKIEEAPAKAEAAEKFAEPPKNVPLPVRRPSPREPKTAKTQKRKNPDEIKQAKVKASAREKEKIADDKIAALLNKQEPAATGKKRSTNPASLGSDKSNAATKLSRSEMDALRSAIEQCWNIPIGLSDAENMRVTITMNLASDGSIDGRVNVDASGGESSARRAFAESARRAVQKCAPYNLPNEKYDTWSQVVVNFDPSQMF